MHDIAAHHQEEEALEEVGEAQMTTATCHGRHIPGHLRHRDDGGGLRPIQDHHREALQDVANHRVGVHHAEGEEVQATVPGAAIVEAQADRGVGQDIEDGGKAEMHLEAGGRYPKRA